MDGSVGCAAAFMLGHCPGVLEREEAQWVAITKRKMAPLGKTIQKKKPKLKTKQNHPQPWESFSRMRAASNSL